VQFPYAIALYVFAAPWAAFTRDNIALLRVVVCAAEAIAGLLMYWAIARIWRDRTTAALALVLYHLLPESYIIARNANLANGFGQSAALAAMSALIAWRLAARDWLQVAGLALLTATALLSHVSTFALLGATMALAGIVTWWRGGAAAMPAARSILIALAIAAGLSVALYYGRPEFYPAYKSAATARPETKAAAPESSAESPASPAPASGARLGEGAIPTMGAVGRVTSALRLALEVVGWPIALLALAGAWRVAADPSRNRLNWAIGAWLAASGVFLVFGIVAPGGVGHQRQALEFIARALYAGSPAVLILAGRGAAWAWRTSTSMKIAAVCLIAVAVMNAGQQWLGWLR
jgi:hypothetical protein